MQFSGKCHDLDLVALNGLWTKSQWEQELSDRNKLCLGIFMNSRIVAIVSGTLILDELEINVVAVDPSIRRIGLGEKVISKILYLSHSLGAKRAILEVKSNNYAANQLYKKIGFKTCGYRKKYYRDGSDAIIYELDLNIKES